MKKVWNRVRKQLQKKLSPLLKLFYLLHVMTGNTDLTIASPVSVLGYGTRDSVPPRKASTGPRREGLLDNEQHLIRILYYHIIV